LEGENMIKIVVINGYPGSGKDTFVEFCEQEVRTFNLLTSTPVKEAFKTLGWNGQKTAETRKALADMMEISERVLDTSFKYIEKSLSEILSYRKTGIVFIHSREPRNIIRYKEKFKAVTLLIDRKVATKIDNEADANVYDFEYDYVIENNGTLEDFERKAKMFARKMYLAGINY
jgi:RNase adaptor protein for sRNA GlmZ degradation